MPSELFVPPARKYVAIAGNIGAGKSSLTRIVSEYFHWEPFYEQVDDNPYLADFYEDMKRWSFNLQVFFLSSRLSSSAARRERARASCRTGRSTRTPRSSRATSTR